jgi:hypothetical protein
MAKDRGFPDDKLGWKPHPDSRSVLEEFRQITIGLEFSSAQLRGEKLDGAKFAARQKADAGKPKTRASAVRDMEAANSDLVSARGTISRADPRRLDP